MSYTIDLNKNLENQVETIDFSINNIEIFIQKVGSFYPLIKLIQEQNIRKDCIVTIICLPYNSVDCFKLPNFYKYCFTITHNNVNISIDDINLDYKNTTIYEYNKNNITYELPNTFVIDLFQIYPNINNYKWINNYINTPDKDSNKNMLSGEYIRHINNIIEIRSYPGRSGYSGSVSYYDINLSKVIYSSCSCFEDANFLETYLKPPQPTKILTSENWCNINWNDTKCLFCSSILNDNFVPCDNNCGTFWCDICHNDMHFIINDTYIITKGHVSNCYYED